MEGRVLGASRDLDYLLVTKYPVALLPRLFSSSLTQTVAEQQTIYRICKTWNNLRSKEQIGSGLHLWKTKDRLLFNNV